MFWKSWLQIYNEISNYVQWDEYFQHEYSMKSYISVTVAAEEDSTKIFASSMLDYRILYVHS